MKNAEGETVTIPEGQTKVWNYHPNLPLANSPVFRWPPRLIFVLNWFRRAWLDVSSATIWTALAFISWYWLAPDLKSASDLAPGWVAGLLLRNFVYVLVVAGGLHYLLYTRRWQGERLQFDLRPIARGHKAFTFSDQVKDNMFWTLVWGVPTWTAYEVLYLWGVGNGFAPLVSFASNPVWFVLMFWFVLLWKGFHFYWIHRLIHWPPLYRIAHAVHHRNLNTGPWSGISMHPVEQVLYFSTLLVHFIVPSHPVHFLFHAFAMALNPALSHSGFDALLIKDKRKLEMGEFFHQLHHRYFECNYGTPEMPWDKWFHTFHDGSEKDTLATRTRKQTMYGP